NQRLRRVQVLRLRVAKGAAAEPDHVSIAVTDREHQAVPAPVIVSAGVSRAGESRLGGELGGDIPRREEVEQGVPRLGRKAELEGVDHLWGNAALLDVLAALVAMSRIEQNVVEPRGGELVDL